MAWKWFDECHTVVAWSWFASTKQTRWNPCVVDEVENWRWNPTTGTSIWRVKLLRLIHYVPRHPWFYASSCNSRIRRSRTAGFIACVGWRRKLGVHSHWWKICWHCFCWGVLWWKFELEKGLWRSWSAVCWCLGQHGAGTCYEVVSWKDDAISWSWFLGTCTCEHTM